MMGQQFEICFTLKAPVFLVIRYQNMHATLYTNIILLGLLIITGMS